MDRYGLVGYSTSPMGAKKIAALIVPIRPFRCKLPRHNIEFDDIEIENVGLDCLLTTLYDRLNAYVCFPPLVLTENDHAKSTIQKALDWRPSANRRKAVREDLKNLFKHLFIRG